MAESVVGPLISMLKDKASSYLLEQYRVMDGMEAHRETLKRKLPAILDIIQDAEEKGAYRPGVRAWLEALKNVAYEANNVFDEFKYEVLRREAKEKGHYKKLGFDILSLFPAHNPIVFRYRMGKKLCRIVETIEVLIAEMNAFGFKHMQQAPPSKQWRVTDSILKDSEKDIVSRSRDTEKKQIVSILVDQASGRDLIILPIVGMGGLGKTTFAQLVYNDPTTKEHFQLQRWCCVSDDFDVTKIASNICQTNEINREKALQDLQKEVSGKRYIIVLDDVWNEDAEKWEKLKTCLKHGAKGSAILTTTRNAKVAQIMKMCIDSRDLGKLHKDFLKEIFVNRALCLQEPIAAEPDQSGVVDKILDRCGGSPLAAKAFGSMLSNKTSIKEWEDILARSKTFNEDTETLPILKLSYDDLPSQLKQCFAFCALFPKDYEIDVDVLIQLWMAHDLIQLKKGDNLEKVGRDIFDELTWRSFFQDVKQTPRREWQALRSRTICKIHDLMHDIALSIMRKDCLTIIDRPDEKELLSTGPTRHMFLSYRLIGGLLDDYLQKNSPTLQTIMYAGYTRGSAPHLCKYNHLRALQLYGFSKLPLQPRHLEHLRYLDLSRNFKIKELPKDLCILYNLQTLNLSSCPNLGRLPKDMKYMVNLRHLYTNGCSSLECMPPDLGQLTSLQTITYFVVGSSSGCSTIKELQDLNLSGELEISRLQYVTEEEAKACSLGNKENLTHLSLKWSDQNNEVLNQHKNVLVALKPHVVLEFLSIDSYRGIGFPAWATVLTFLEHLTELHLVACTMCEEFPQFSQFKALEVLVLKKLDNLQSLCCQKSSEAFPALKDLILESLIKFERWVATEGEEITFPLLEKVQIKNCPKLRTLPEAPKLKVMKLKEEKVQLSLSIFRSRYMSCLSELSLTVSDTEATCTPELDQDHEVSLSELELYGCSFLYPSIQSQLAGNGVWKWFDRLGKLDINKCDKLIYWPEEEFRSLASLKNLSIRYCSNLKGPTQVKGHPTRGRDQFLPNLKELTIICCESLTELFVLPASLTSILIAACDSLESILGQDDRESKSLPQFNTASSPEHCNDLAYTSMPEQSPSPTTNPLPCLEFLHIICCKKLRFLPAMLDTLEGLLIEGCNGLTSLDCLGQLPFLKTLVLEKCKHLASVPGSEGNYSALQKLVIQYCPAINMKSLYGRLQQRLERLEYKDLAHAVSCDPFNGPKLWEPKSWKYMVPSLRKR
ncbi:hypothetical protein ACQJBY_000395 [Aegilops geniculata]